ncbi:hypothetical protein [Rhodococcus koreensis]
MAPPTQTNGAQPDTAEVPGTEGYSRAQRALDMRIAGLRWVEIGRDLGYPSAQRACEEARAFLSKHELESVDRWRDMQAARCESLIRSLWPAAMKGDTAAVGAVIKVFERESRLLGLDRPAQVAVAVTTTGADSTLVGALRDFYSNHPTSPAIEGRAVEILDAEVDPLATDPGTAPSTKSRPYNPYRNKPNARSRQAQARKRHPDGTFMTKAEMAEAEEAGR